MRSVEGISAVHGGEDVNESTRRTVMPSPRQQHQDALQATLRRLHSRLALAEASGNAQAVDRLADDLQRIVALLR
jgi:hypothetical protein